MRQEGKPIGVVEVKGGGYRVRKKINGKYVHVCSTTNYMAGLIAFDLFTMFKGLDGRLNFFGISQGALLSILEKLDQKVYNRIINMIGIKSV